MSYLGQQIRNLSLSSIINFICPAQLVRTVIFSAAIRYKKLKFSMKITMAYAHLVYTLFCPSAEYEGRGLGEGVEGKNHYLSL